jgi:hypothetical protein
MALPSNSVFSGRSLDFCQNPQQPLSVLISCGGQSAHGQPFATNKTCKDALFACQSTPSGFKSGGVFNWVCGLGHLPQGLVLVFMAAVGRDGVNQWLSIVECECCKRQTLKAQARASSAMPADIQNTLRKP